MTSVRWLSRILGVAMLLMLPPAAAIAQATHFSTPVGAGSETERYLRALQLVGGLPASQWSVRPFGPRELDSMTLPSHHPWASRLTDSSMVPRSTWGVVSPAFSVIQNSSFPYGFNDGPVWAGKGATLVASGGVAASRSGISVALNPVAFIAQNLPFSINPNGRTGAQAFNSWLAPGTIDLPQRFGATAYGRLDPGESHIRWDTRWIALGVASESEVWGPAAEYPLILGNNAGGFPRAFAGTSAPIDLRVVKIHGRILWGRLDQSDYGPASGDARRHFATAATGVMTIAGMPGLELGAARFFHTAWPTGGLGAVPWFRVFQGLLANNLKASPTDADNQLASVFFRWAPPAAGFEVYGEYGAEDHSYNLRDLSQQPDHDVAFVLGMERVWRAASSGNLTVLRCEIMNSRISQLQQAANETPWYVHSQELEGHTQRGQALGSVGGLGGGASTVAIDHYFGEGRFTVRWDRIMLAEFRLATGLPDASRADVVHSIGVERAVFWRGGETSAGISLGREYNRYFAGDAWNVSSFVGYRFAK